ncbi:MAG: hypothetical protein ACQES1_10045, partial [Bacteroidota bacterium]
MKKIVFTILTIIGISMYSNGQEISNTESFDKKYPDTTASVEKSNRELKANKYFFSYSYDKAIDLYLRTKNLSVEGQRNLAISYHNMEQNTLAENAWEDLLSNEAGILPEDYFNYAMILKINGKYEQSFHWMDIFSDKRPNDLRVANYMANKALFPELLEDDGNYKITHLDINTEADDFGTCYYKDKIVFASSRSKPSFIVKKFNWNRKPFWDMYVSEVDENQLSSPEVFDKGLNGKMHDGPASFSNNGTAIAFTRNNYSDKSTDRIIELQIWFSNFEEGEWSTPEPFKYNNNEYSMGHPCLSSNGKVMYFTSDMPGGFGGADLYITKKDANGKWGKPRNLGKSINTEGDEMFPFFEENNNVMFFASNGHFGLGGLDIFMSEKKGDDFNNVYNAGFPLNTSFDDYSFIINKTLNSGYFSSNRSNGNGGSDIYTVDLMKPLGIGNKTENVIFTVNAPENIPVQRRVRETFPIHNYVFFDLMATEIPDRYVLLTKNQVKEFKEDQLEVFLPKNLSGRSSRQMTAYYNILNILGDRMAENPTAVVRLSGASLEGIDTGLAMAESVKKYLVDIFEIDAERINTEGRLKPRTPSDKYGSKYENSNKREGDNRVSIWSESPALMMEFQSGQNTPLKPVELSITQVAPPESYVTFNVDGGINPIETWSLEIIDENGTQQNFGPYTLNQAAIPGKAILGNNSDGTYKVKMISKMNDGLVVEKDTSLNMVLWTPSENEEGMRFSIIYEFDNSEAINIYDTYLTDIVTPKIPTGSSVIISGYTDNTG